MNGDTGLAYDLVSAQMADGVDVGTVLFDLLAPMQRDVGRRWQTGEYRVADEHASTATLETLVALLGGSLDLPQGGRRYAIVAAEGDNHGLPARMVATYLVYLGYNVINLGASVPAADLGGYLVEHEIEVLLLTCAATASLRGARSCVATAHANKIPVVVGGRAFGPDDQRAKAIGADGWVADPRQLPEFLETWAPDVVSAESGYAAVEPLEVRMPQLVGGLILSVPGLRPAEAARIVAVIDAAELTGDRRILGELLDWYRLRTYSPDTLVDEGMLLAGILAAVPLEDPLWTTIAELDH